MFSDSFDGVHLKESPFCTQVYIIEANPRASRTVPFVAKAIGHPLAAYASLLMSGKTLQEIGFTEEPTLNHVAVKEAVLPFEKFQGACARMQAYGRAWHSTLLRNMLPCCAESAWPDQNIAASTLLALLPACAPSYFVHDGCSNHMHKQQPACS